MYKPFAGLQSERNRILGGIKMPPDVSTMGLGAAGGPTRARGYGDSSVLGGNNSIYDKQSL